MHSLNYICTISIVVSFFLLSSCKHDDHAAQHENAAKEVVEDDHNHSDEIILSHSTAERFGVKTAKLTSGMFNEVIKVSGHRRSSRNIGPVIRHCYPRSRHNPRVPRKFRSYNSYIVI